MSSGDDEKTEVITGVQETLQRELQKAKEQDACLIIIRGTPQGHRFFLTQDEMTVGRDSTAEICISDGSISRKHATLVKQDNVVFFQDLNSSNGSEVNGKKVSGGERVELAKEDVIKIGNTFLKYLPAGELEILFYNKMGSDANTDDLTRLYNKRYLMEALEVEFKRAKALSSDFSIIFFDLDHFKKVNDTYGHDAGDFVLREFSKLVQGQLVRENAVFARYGGEEFVVLLGNVGIEEAAKLAEEIRVTVSSYAFVYEGKRLPVTTSLGVAEIKPDMSSSHTLLKTADLALYQAKNSGRNRVSVA